MRDLIQNNKKIFIILVVLLVAVAGFMIYGKVANKNVEPSDQEKETYNYAVNSIEELDELKETGTLLYPKTNELFRYNVYDNHIEITEYIGDKEDVTVPATLEDLPVLQINAKTFSNSVVKNVTIEDGIVFIDNNAFLESESLESVTIPDSVLKLGDYCFTNCPNLQTVKFGNRIKEIASSAFADCIKLNNVSIPDSLEIIGPSAFNGCISLTEITIPASVSEIPDSCFFSCENLLSVTIMGDSERDDDGDNEETQNTTVRSIGDNAFYNCASLASVWIPSDITAISESAFEMTPRTLTFSGYSSTAAASFAATQRINFVVLDIEQFQASSKVIAEIKSKINSAEKKFAKTDEFDTRRMIIPSDSKDAFYAEIERIGNEYKNNKSITAFTVNGNGFNATLDTTQKLLIPFSVAIADDKEEVVETTTEYETVQVDPGSFMG